MNTQKWTLPHLSLPFKALFTGYLLVVGLGLLMAGAQIMFTHGMADGKLGLSVDDIVYSYHGKAGGTQLEAKLEGSMKDKAPEDVRREMIQWAHLGAPEAEWEPKFKQHFQQYCVMCHSTIPGIPNFTEYKAVQATAKIDEGVSVESLTRVSHIHLFGIAFIFMFVGLIFSFAVGFKPWVQATLIFTPFAFLILDILSWWLTKMSPGFAWLTIMGGIGYSIASAVMIFTSLYQMWFYKKAP